MPTSTTAAPGLIISLVIKLAFPAAATLCRMAVAALADGDPDNKLLAPEPLYLRRPDAWEPGPRKRVTPV